MASAVFLSEIERKRGREQLKYSARKKVSHKINTYHRTAQKKSHLKTWFWIHLFVGQIHLEILLFTHFCSIFSAFLHIKIELIEKNTFNGDTAWKRSSRKRWSKKPYERLGCGGKKPLHLNAIYPYFDWESTKIHKFFFWPHCLMNLLVAAKFVSVFSMMSKACEYIEEKRKKQIHKLGWLHEPTIPHQHTVMIAVIE